MISAAMQTALETGGYRVGYYAEVVNRSGVKTATLEMESGSISSTWMDPVRRNVEFFIPLSGSVDGSDSFGGLVPEPGIVTSIRTMGEGEYGQDLYGYSEEERAVITSVLKPFENRVRIIGEYTFEGSTETEDLGLFTIATVTFKDNETGFTARVSCWDSAGDIALQRFNEPVNIGASTNISPALNALLGDYLPQGVSMSLGTITGDTTPALNYLPGDSRSPWDAAREVAMGAGKLLVSNRSGNIVVEDIPSDASEYPASSWTVSDTTVISRQNYSPDATECVNRVIVVGENASEDPVWAQVDDLNGQWGSITTGVVIAKEHASDTAKTVAQCVNLGNALLRKHGKLSEVFEIQTALNPSLEPGDVITLNSIGLGINVDLVIEEVSYPLSVTDFMTLSCTRAV